MIILRKLTTVGLCETYARTMDNGTIRHYYVSYAKILASDKTAEEMVRDYVTKETGESIATEVLKNNNAYGIDAIFGVRDAKDVLVNLPKIKKELEKQKIDGMLYQYNAKPEWYKYLLNPIAMLYNWFAFKINTIWAKSQWKKMGGFPEDRFEYLNTLSKIKSIPIMPVAGWFRAVSPCNFLTVTFDDSSRDKAIKALQKDLKILSDNKLIMGHMSMPFQLQLADTVGSGEQSHVLACFLFIDNIRLSKIVGKKKYEEALFDKNRKLILNSLLGLETESFEGALSDVDFRKKYTIEEVNICEGEREANQKAYIESYEEQQELLKKINKRNMDLEKRGKEIDKQREEARSKQDATIDPSKLNYDAPTLISDKED